MIGVDRESEGQSCVLRVFELNQSLIRKAGEEGGGDPRHEKRSPLLPLRPAPPISPVKSHMMVDVGRKRDRCGRVGRLVD